MGEASTKKRAHANLLCRFPCCIYCGAVADTVEHMPPVTMFRRKQRPKGLEFSSCRRCNHGTSKSDLVASLLARSDASASYAFISRAVYKSLYAPFVSLLGLEF